MRKPRSLRCYDLTEALEYTEKKHKLSFGTTKVELENGFIEEVNDILEFLEVRDEIDYSQLAVYTADDIKSTAGVLKRLPRVVTRYVNAMSEEFGKDAYYLVGF
jgi:trehalose-6-phosphate synthase